VQSLRLHLPRGLRTTTVAIIYSGVLPDFALHNIVV